MFEKSIDNLKERVTTSLVDRLLKNSGINNLVDNPKDYRVIFEIDDEDYLIKIMKKQ